MGTKKSLGEKTMTKKMESALYEIATRTIRSTELHPKTAAALERLGLIEYRSAYFGRFGGVGAGRYLLLTDFGAGYVREKNIVT